MPIEVHSTVGWDIGGAHVKLACMNKQKITAIYQLSCPLWKGINELRACITILQDKIDLSKSIHAITMTGELVDYFDNRQDGVVAIISTMNDVLSNNETYYYAGQKGLISPKQAINDYKAVASANWLASAEYISKKTPNALFIDIGSTTTDIVAIQDYQIVYKGYTDEQRLIERELVYSGVVRTPVFAICKSALVRGHQVPIINEYFANMADVYRITAELNEQGDLTDTLDGRSKDKLNSAKRLARMFANDADSGDLDLWTNVARQVRNQHLQLIKDACRHQLMKKSISLTTPLVGAGVGRFLLRDLARQLGREYIDVEKFFNFSKGESFSVADCTPAAAMACLAYEK